MTSIRLDLNNPLFQQNWFALQKTEQLQVMKTLQKIFLMSWEQLYQDRGLRWEAIHSRQGPQGTKLYSLRISKCCRAIAFREETWLRLLSIHPDHDSAYG